MYVSAVGAERRNSLAHRGSGGSAGIESVERQRRGTNMKSLGIVGGIGPESTIEYYRFIIAEYRERTRDDSYPHILIDSIDVTKGVALVQANDLEGLADYVGEAARRLGRAGVDFGLMAANTPHIAFDAIQRRSPFQLLSIVQAT